MYVLTQEVLISDSRFSIKVDVKIPRTTESRRGVVLVHGGMLNRKSLSRDTLSLAGYLCDALNAYVITPDYLGDTTYSQPRTLNRFCEVVDYSLAYFCAHYGLEDIMGFGHSLGSYIITKVAKLNDNISHLVTYGGPTDHILKNRQRGFIQYLIKYLQSFDYGVDLREMLPYLFDGETSRYLKEVMMVEPEYSGENYDFTLDPKLVQDLVEYLGSYLDDLKEWGKPAMLLYGTNDSVVSNSMRHLPDGHRMDNILVKHVKGASHVTPCMDSLANMKKLDPMLLFHRNIVKDRAKHLLT